MQVKDLMSSHVISVSPDVSTLDAARLFGRYNIGALPVLSQDGRLRGIVTDRDIVLRCIAAENDPGETKIKEIMSRRFTTVAPEEDVREAARLMAEERVRRLPVVSGGKVVGMISLGDIAQTDTFNMEASKALSEISSNLKRL